MSSIFTWSYKKVAVVLLISRKRVFAYSHFLRVYFQVIKNSYKSCNPGEDAFLFLYGYCLHYYLSHVHFLMLRLLLLKSNATKS